MEVEESKAKDEVVEEINVNVALADENNSSEDDVRPGLGNPRPPKRLRRAGGRH